MEGMGAAPTHRPSTRLWKQCGAWPSDGAPSPSELGGGWRPPHPPQHILGLWGLSARNPNRTEFQKQEVPSSSVCFLPASCLSDSKSWTLGACSVLLSLALCSFPPKATGH